MDVDTTSADDDAPDWPLHQRLSGVAARTLAVGLAVLPALALLNRRVSDSAMILALLLAFVLPVLAVERRDVGLPSALLRHLVGAIVGVALVPVALVSLQHAGDPMGVYVELGRLLEPRAVLVFALGAPFASLPFALLAAVRVRTARLGPQVVAGLVIPALLAASWLETRWSFRSKMLLLLLLTGVLVPLALVGAERAIARRDPRAPRPTERDPRPCFAGLGVLLLLAGLLPAFFTRIMGRRFYDDYQERSGSTIVKEVGSRLRLDARPDQAISWTNEPHEGFLVRALLADGGRWCVAADPLDPALRAGRSWVADHTGTLRSYAAPVAIDADACAAPPAAETP